MRCALNQANPNICLQRNVHKLLWRNHRVLSRTLQQRIVVKPLLPGYVQSEGRVSE
jgi:hypothetical protein